MVPPRHGSRRLSLLTLAPVLLCGSMISSNASAQPDEAGKVPKLVERYFRCNAVPEREGLRALIEQAAGDNFEEVVSAVRSLQLWDDLPRREGRLSAHPAGLERFEVQYRVPADYDPEQATPLLICLPDERTSAETALHLAQAVCGESIQGFVLAAPERPLHASFHAGEVNARIMRALLRAVRREVHIDANRVFLFGIGAGADAAWMVALFEPTTFAGLVALGGYPQLPYPEQTYPWLLENLRTVPTLVGQAPMGLAPKLARNAEQVDARMAVILDLARKSRLPLEQIPLSRSEPRALARADSPAADAHAANAQLTRLFARERAPGAQAAARWFRFPGQGNAGWLRQSKFRGEPWTADQLSIVTAPGTDFAQYVTDTIQAKLAYLAGSIEGQQITIEASKCARIEILLGPEMVDFSQPISIRCNGQKRRPRRVEPSIATLLETAYERWEFQHLVAARVTLPVKSDAAGK